MELLVPLTIACDVRREGKRQNHFILLLFFFLSTSPRANFKFKFSKFNRRFEIEVERSKEKKEKKNQFPIEIQVGAESVEYDDEDEKFTNEFEWVIEWVRQAPEESIHTQNFSRKICEEIKVNEISGLFLVCAYWVIWFLCFDGMHEIASEAANSKHSFASNW